MKSILYCTILTLGFGLATLISAQESLKDRPTDVRVTFSDSKLYKGSYSGHATARVCGQTDPIHFGRKTFLLEYPLDLPAGDSIQDVTFYSNELVDGVKTTAGFHVSVNVKSPAMGHPAAYVVDTLNPRDNAVGRATLTVKGAEIGLALNVTNGLGEKLELLVTCNPPKK